MVCARTRAQNARIPYKIPRGEAADTPGKLLRKIHGFQDNLLPPKAAKDYFTTPKQYFAAAGGN